MEYFLSLPPFNVSTHSNLLLKSSSHSSTLSSDSPFRSLIQPFNSLSYRVFEPLLTTDEAGHLSYEFDLPETDLAWELLVFANTQENQWGSARTDLPVTPKLKILPILPSFLTVGDSTELGVQIHNPSSQSIESVLILESSSLSLQGENQIAINVGPGERKTLFWPIKVLKADLKNELKITFNGQSNLHPLNIHPVAVSSSENKNQVFAWLSFHSLKHDQAVTEFKRGEIYQGHLSLIFPQAYSSAPAKPEGETADTPLTPLKISIPLPAGLKMRSWLGSLSSPEGLSAERASAELKAVDETKNPLWFFQNIGFHSSQIELSALNLPAGAYQFDFEVQAVWPGHFKMPTLNWGGTPVVLEEAGSVRVE